MRDSNHSYQPHRAGAQTQNTVFSASPPGLQHRVIQTHTSVPTHEGFSVWTDKKKEQTTKVVQCHNINCLRKERRRKNMWNEETQARCCYEADCTCHILWGPSSCAAIFSFRKTLAPNMSWLSLTKHLCHIINLSQSFLCSTKNTGSSVLISVSNSIFLPLCQRFHFDCSLGGLWHVHAN